MQVVKEEGRKDLVSEAQISVTGQFDPYDEDGS